MDLSSAEASAMLHWQKNWSVGFLVLSPTKGKTTQVSERECQVDIERSAVGGS